MEINEVENVVSSLMEQLKQDGYDLAVIFIAMKDGKTIHFTKTSMNPFTALLAELFMRKDVDGLRNTIYKRIQEATFNMDGTRVIVE